MADVEEEKTHVAWCVVTHPEGLATNCLPKGFMGGDGVVVLALRFNKDGSTLVTSFTVDGRTTKPLERLQVFKAWASLASMLVRNGELPARAHRLVKYVHDEVLKTLTEARKQKSEKGRNH